jgi:hypothetical protein
MMETKRMMLVGVFCPAPHSASVAAAIDSVV